MNLSYRTNVVHRNAISIKCPHDVFIFRTPFPKNTSERQLLYINIFMIFYLSSFIFLPNVFLILTRSFTINLLVVWLAWFFVTVIFIGIFCHCRKNKFSVKDFFSKFDQIRRKLRICSRLLKKSFKEKFIFCAVCYRQTFKTVDTICFKCFFIIALNAETFLVIANCFILKVLIFNK